jgi:hypothetical protein
VRLFFGAAIEFSVHICCRNSGPEAVLDIEYTVGVAGGVPVTFISVGPDNNDGVMGALVRTCNFPAGMFHSTHEYDVGYCYVPPRGNG